jgi:serine/threonine protein phosphatase PrpC
MMMMMMRMVVTTIMVMTVVLEKDPNLTVVGPSLFANVGDSQAILCHAGQAFDLTTDHKPNDVSERRPIEECVVV